MDVENKILALIRGVPGCGKYSFAKDIANGAPVYSNDDYFMDGNIYKWDPKEAHRAHRDCLTRTEKAMIDDTPKIFVCNTFIRASDVT